MGRRRNEITAAQVDRDWPFKVILSWNEDRSFHQRVSILEQARRLGACSRSGAASLYDWSYAIFSFATLDAALCFRTEYDGELVNRAEFDKFGNWTPAEDGMCNLYNVTTTQDAIRSLTKAMDRLGNLEPSLDIYPDRQAPVVRNTEDGRELAMLTWGMPSPPFVTKGNPDTGVTNIRNIGSAHWRRWLSPANRCVVPWTTFCEWEDTKPKKTKRWFAIDDSKPLAFFAGLWTTWEGERGSQKNPRPGNHELFGFLTCPPNDVVAPIHPKAMPVILTAAEELEVWLNAPWEEAKALQRPLSEEQLILLPVST